MIPDISRPEWEDLVSGQINPKITSLSFQLKLNNLKLSVSLKKMDLKSAANDLHKYCIAKEKLYQKDLNLIFK